MTDETTPETPTTPETIVEKVETAAKNDIAALRSILQSFGHIAKDDLSHTDEEVVQFSNNLLVHMKKVLQNSGIVIGHTITVLESYVSRMDGVMLEELTKGSEWFKGREGWKDLKSVLVDIERLFIKQDANGGTVPPVIQAPPAASNTPPETPTV